MVERRRFRAYNKRHESKEGGHHNGPPFLYDGGQTISLLLGLSQQSDVLRKAMPILNSIRVMRGQINRVRHRALTGCQIK